MPSLDEIQDGIEPVFASSDVKKSEEREIDRFGRITGCSDDVECIARKMLPSGTMISTPNLLQTRGLIRTVVPSMNCAFRNRSPIESVTAKTFAIGACGQCRDIEDDIRVGVVVDIEPDDQSGCGHIQGIAGYAEINVFPQRDR